MRAFAIAILLAGLAPLAAQTTSLTITCTGNATTDLAAINAALAVGNSTVNLNSQSATCEANNSIILFSGDTLAWPGQNLVITMPTPPSGNSGDYSAITNEAVVSPTTHSYTCALTASSNSVTCSTASFTSADVGESFMCPAAMNGNVDLHTSIATVSSGTVIYLSDPTGSSISAGNFSCVEQIRDTGIHIIAGNISVTGVVEGEGRPQELGLGHVKGVVVEGGNWIHPDNSSDWTQLIYDASNVLVQNENLFSFGTTQDGVDFEGPWEDVTVQDLTCDTSDDCVALKDGERWTSTYLLRNTNGSGNGASVSDIQGSSGSRGVAIEAFCVNVSGSCVGSPLTNITIDGVFGQYVSAEYGVPSRSGGFFLPVGIQNSIGLASDFGTTALIDNIDVNNVYGLTPYATGSPSQVTIGSYGGYGANQYYGSIDIGSVGPLYDTSSGAVGSITVINSTNTSYTTNIASIGIDDSSFVGGSPAYYHFLFSITGSNAVITKFNTNNPNLALYNFNGATISNQSIAGQIISLAITAPVTLPSGVAGTAYSQTLAASGGSGTGYTWTITSGSSNLTAIGLSLSSDGVLSGSSPTVGSASVAVEVTDSASNTATANFSVFINAAQAPTFTIAGPAVSVAPGATTGNTSAITVTPGSGGFSGTVSLTCSISPTASNDPATCSLSPTSVTLSGTTAQTSTLTIGTTASTADLVYPKPGNRKGSLGAGSGAVLALLVFFGIPARRRSWRAMLSILVAMIALGALASCGGGSIKGGGNASGGGSSDSGGGGGNPGTTAGTYTVTVTGTSGTTTVWDTATLTIE
jgi:hypothetical protein